MKSIFSTTIALALLSTAHAQQKTSTYTGGELYAKVKKFVSIGEHRTGTPTDSLTGEWLKSEFTALGIPSSFVEFPLKQFFFESGAISTGGKTADIFPGWPVKEGLALAQTAQIIDGDKLTGLANAKGKIVFTRLKHVHGSFTPEIAAQFAPFIQAGAAGIVAVTENSTSEIVAMNTYKDQKTWDIPVNLLAPKDTALVLAAIASQTPVNVNVKGAVKEAKGRDIVAKIGTGKQFVVISTPVSGWFTTGGERGPGIAVWLGLAQWAKNNIDKFPGYTFVFTGNAGHELNFLGAYVFTQKAAPKPEDTKLWVHLGAAVAVRAWEQKGAQWTLADTADSKRYIYYSESVAPAFEKTFAGIKALKLKGTKENEATVKPGGEGSLFKTLGYNNLVSVAYAHRLHHVKNDSEQATTPALLQELENVLQNFISEQLKK